MSKKIIYNCQVCNSECRRVSHSKDAIIYCSPECKKVITDSKILKSETNCSKCKKEITISGRKRTNFLRTDKAYCSRECSSSVQYKAFVEKGKELRKTKEFRKASSDRMKKNNPMWMDGVKEKMIESSKGRTFLSRGGNGQLTKHQMMLHLATGFPMEYPILTVDVKNDFLSVPYCYKVDLAIVDKKIAIEVDGASHKLKKWKFLDKRKTEILNALGWKVIRYTNEEVERNLNKCVRSILLTVNELK